MSTTAPLRPPLKKYRRQTRQIEVRVAALMAALALAFLGLLARLWYLQIYMGEELRQASLENGTRTIPTRAPRGDIRDRSGRPLAESRQSLSLEIAPDYKNTNPQLLQRLAPILHTTEAELEATIKEEKAKGFPYDAIPVVDNLTPQLVAQLEEQRLYLGGVLIQPNPTRYYPMGTVATHLLGYLGMINADELKKLKEYRYRAGDYVGKGGVEREYNRLLRGVDGGRDVEVDAAGRIKRVIKDYPAHPGNTLTLSIDRRVQWAAQYALSQEGGKAGAAVAIDPRNGEVLAMASYPTYDIRLFSTRRPAKLWNPVHDDPRKPLQNRTIMAQYPPASTIKPFIAAEGLQSGTLPAHMTTYCAKGMYVGNRKTWKACWKFHGSVDLEEAISESCDVFFYQASKFMRIDHIVKAATEFGLGSKTGIDLGPEADGEVPTAEWRDRMIKKGLFERWYLGDTMNCSIGQGMLYATPLQMARAVSAMANGGKLYTPHLLLKATSWDGKITHKAKPTYQRVPISPEVFHRIQNAMRLTVTQGTGKSLAMPDVAVAAKSGTAETRKGVDNHGWMTCYAPYESPRIAIAVIVEGGIHGADSGGPVAKAMMEAYFHNRVPPLVQPAAPSTKPQKDQKALTTPPAPSASLTPAPKGRASRFALMRGSAPPPTPKPSSENLLPSWLLPKSFKPFLASPSGDPGGAPSVNTTPPNTSGQTPRHSQRRSHSSRRR